MKKAISLLLISALLIVTFTIGFSVSAKNTVTTKMLDVKFQIMKGTTEQSNSTNVRFIASVDNLTDYSYVGWAFSLTDSTPTVGENGTVYRQNNKVYSSIIADGELLYPSDVYGRNGCSNYLFVFEMTDIPQQRFTTDIYVCAYVVLENGTIVYGEPTCINVKQELNKEDDTTTSLPTSSSTSSEAVSSNDIKFESTDSGWDNRWH